LEKKIYITENDVCSRRSVDSSRLANYFKLNKCVLTNKPEDSDFIIFNTCAYKESRVDQGIDLIRKFKNYKSELIVLGCLPAIAPKRLKENFNGNTLSAQRLDEIDKFFPDFKAKFKEVPDTNTTLPKNERKNSISLKNFITKFEFTSSFFQKCMTTLKDEYKFSVKERQERNKTAHLRIVDGCLGKCSFCAIRFATGRTKSKPLNVCLEEYKKLLDEGYRNFIIDGEDTGSYGLDINSSFSELQSKMSEIDKKIDVKWKIHTFSPHYAVMYKDKLLESMREEKIDAIKSDVQSGNKRILKLMYRYPKIETISEIYSEFKKANPSLYTHSSFIVGFPSETDDEFQDTLNIMKQLKLSGYFLHKYTDMEGTIATKMPNRIPNKVKEERLKIAKEFFEKENYIVNLSEDILVLEASSSQIYCFDA